MDEKQYLNDLAQKPFATRMFGYLKFAGPGYMQSAMTLGGGSIAACVIMGSMLGYELLWVQPLAIFFGVCVLGAVGKQACVTGEQPYQAFWNRLHPGMAIAWGGAALIATVLWHIPQYGLTANGAIVLAEGAGLNLDSTAGRWGIGVCCLAAASFVLYLYSTGAKGLKIYENMVKFLVWGIVLAFAVAAISTDIQWGALFRGITGIDFFHRCMAEGGFPKEVIAPVVGGIAAAVGINMVFLYPYSLLNKGWGKEHKELAYFDLVSGMMLPFLIATGFMTIAVANTIGPQDGSLGTGVRDMREIIPVLTQTLPNWLALIVIGFGMFAVGFSTIITHMLASRFIGCELFAKWIDADGKLVFPIIGLKVNSKLFFSFLPAVGIVGVKIEFPFLAAVTASVLAAPLMPVAVIGFIILMNMKSYMGDDTPTGLKRLFWNTALILSVVVLSFGAYNALKGKYEGWKAQQAAPAVEAPVQEDGGEAAANDDKQAMNTPMEPDAHFGDEYTSYTTIESFMGSDFTFRLYGDSARWGTEELRAVAETTFTQLNALENRISTWVPDSYASKVNSEGASHPVAVDPDTFAMLQTTKRIHAETDGVFDVTVGPLVQLWRDVKKNSNSQPTLS